MNAITTDELDGLFASLPTDDEPTQRRLHQRLTGQAQAEGLLDVAYRTMDTPIGSLLLVTTTQGLVRIAFDGEGHDQVLEHLSDVISPRILRAPARLDDVVRELDEYFAGRRRVFDLVVDHRLTKGFRGEVLEHLRTIAYGGTQTYAQVASAAGRPKAVRAVGSACANNPIPVVVPCHRVVRSDGSLGGYRGGLPAKRELLALELAGSRLRTGTT